MALSLCAQSWHGRARFIPGIYHGQRPARSTDKRAAFRAPAPKRLLRHPQSVERRHRPLSAGARLQGAGDHQFRLRPFARVRRRRGNRATMVLAHFAEIAGGDRRAGQRRLRGRLCRRPGTALPRTCGCACETGVAGLSIEDFDRRRRRTRSTTSTLRSTRVQAARAAIDKAGGDVVFTARTEGFISGRPDLAETIRRLKAFADAGADCLYSPGIKTREQIEATVKAVAPKPVNLLNSGAFGFTVKRLARDGRAPHQRRRHAGARRHARFHQGGDAKSPRTANSTVSPA